MIRHYTSIALVDLSYLFTRNYRGAGVNAPPNAGANRTLDDVKHISDDVDHVIICLDTGPYLRRDRFPAYKQHREDPPAEEVAQKRAVIDALRARGYVTARKRGYEADDVIATLAKSYGEWCQEIRIIASDKDIAQCITKNVIQYVPSHGTRDAERRDYLKCKVKFGVYPKDMPLWQAMVGDSSDGVPGVPKIGEKKATYVIDQLRLAAAPSTLQGLAQYLATTKRTGMEWTQLANHWETLRVALDLVTLDTAVPLDVEALLVKPEPELQADDEMGVEGFEPNATPSGSPPEDGIELDDLDDLEKRAARARAEAARLEALQPPPVAPPASPSPAQQQVDAAAAEAHQRKAAGQVDPTGRATEKGAANDQTPPPAARPPVTEAEFDPISRAPGATTALPPLPPKPEPQPAVAAAPAPPPAPAKPPEPKPQPNPAAIVKAQERQAEWGLVSHRLQPTDLQSAWTLAKWLCGSGLYKNLETPQQVFAIIHRGVELGLDIGTALMGFHMIQGKPSMSADLIRSLAKSHPDCEYFFCESSDEEQATWVTRNRRHPPGVVQRLTYTIEEARQDPSLWKKDRFGGPSMWEKRPKQMLSKTCSSVLARQEFESKVIGFYCPEELSNGFVDTVGVAA
jgi:5'-3' exonuclease